jgi:DNA-binding response OmpR family regulator
MASKNNEILIVDDEPLYAEMLSSTLSEEGYRPRVFTSPEEALEWLGKNACALVLTDFTMPVLNGAEFIQKVKELHPRLPIIIISGQMNTRDLLQVANIGISLALEKPLDKATLLASVGRFVKSPKAPNNKNLVAHPAKAQGAAKVKKKQEFTYPAEQLRTSQASEGIKLFLQSLWEAIKSVNGATLALPLGGELELIVADVEHWFSLEAPALRLSPTMMDVDIASFEGSHTLAILDARYAMDDLHDQVRDLRARLPKEMPLLVLMRSDNAKPTGELPLITLPPLNQRIADIAEYSRTILERVTEHGSLLPDAARLLLNYPWPGNYYELMGALRRAVMVEEEVLKIDAKALASAIASGHGAASPALSGMSMENFLVASQGRWFEAHGCTDIDTAAAASGVDKAHFIASQPLARQPLLMPELL